MGAPNHCRGAEKSNNATRTFFSTIHLLPKDLSFEHGSVKLASSPGTIKPRHAPASASFVLGLQQVATAVLRNFEIVRVNCCSRNACVFPPFENIVYISVMCGYRPARVRQQSVNQTVSFNCAKQVGFLRIGSVFGCRQIRCPAAGS